ncbi:MAG: SDR family NAD(P)-dependent oxidoreductase, partial [Muribaculaceae bacterium]|nr:SDR family NAD(P)-dependent oxidoreductase [Muribaculaceae bacterium]
MDMDSLFDLTGKVAVVTGGGDGIGKGCCEILAAAGASVVVSDLSLEKAQDVARSIEAAGGKAVVTGCNVLQKEDLDNLIAFAVKNYGTINILVNNAGMG